MKRSLSLKQREDLVQEGKNLIDINNTIRETAAPYVRT